MKSRRKDFGLLNQHPEIQVFLTADDPTMKIQWPLLKKSVAISVILLKKLPIVKKPSKAAMAITNQELDAVIIAGKELIVTKSSKERKKTILETQLSQMLSIKKSREHSLDFLVFFLK